MGHRWDPVCERPQGLVAPVRVDPAGVHGPTENQARGPAWRQTSWGMYVPSHVDGTLVEQRIVEAAGRLTTYGAVTGWAALRWYGATFFDGTGPGGEGERPVPLIASKKLRPDLRTAVFQDQLAPTERMIVDGLPCATVQRALFDAVRRTNSAREAANLIAMAAAAQLISRRLFAMYVAQRNAWTGVPLARKAVALAVDECRSPQEFRMLMCWLVDADLPMPLLNREVYDLDGRLIGIPDLFDPVAGLAGEYQGADHKDGKRHRADVAREEDFRDHGVEFFEVVGGDLGRRQLVVDRMRSARARAKFLPPESCAWTLEPPPRRPRPETLDEYLIRTGRADRLWRT